MKTYNKGFLILNLAIMLVAFSGFSIYQGTLQYYKGKIGTRDIQMSLELEGNQMTGSFIYEESGEVLVLKGTIVESSQSVLLNVVNDKDVNVARIQAHYYTNELEEITKIKGGIIELKTNRRRLLNLDKVAEFLAINDEKPLQYY